MVRELEPSLVERDFVLAAIENGQRMDGRGIEDMRQVDLSFPNEFGYCECRLGQTRVAAQVSCEITRATPERPYEGNLIVSAEISPMASVAYEAGRPSEKEAVIARLLEKALRQSGAVDREALCIVASEKVWTIRIDLHFLDDQGNLVDCACIAAMAGLLHFRKPDVTVAGQDVTVHSIEKRVPVPLAIHHSPLCLTYAFLGEKHTALVDPIHIEEQLANGTMTLTLNAQSEICVLTKAGGAPMLVRDIMQCITFASAKIKAIDRQIKEALKKDAKSRQLHAGDSGLGVDRS